MGLHVLIDGYNLIRRSPALSAEEQISLQDGREALLRRLATYRAIKRHPITVVFDAAEAPMLSDGRTKYRGITVMFSPPGQTADRVLKKLVQREQDRAVVVTSDRDIVQFAHSQGAATIDSMDFERKMTMAVELDEREQYLAPNSRHGWTPTTRKKGPARRLSKRARRHRVRTKKL